MEKITIDIVSDVACPWCYVGKKHLEKALEQKPELNVTIHWHPFELDPTIPAEGVERDTYFEKKFGDLDRFESMTNRLVEIGDKAGINFNFEEMKAAVRTLPLHQLLHVANKEGFGAELKEAFLAAYFEKGVDFRVHKNIVKIVERFGWDADKVKSIIEDQEIAYWVTQEIRHYQNLGVTGVPFFIFNNKYGVSGAQPPSAFMEMLDKMSTKTIQQGEACNTDSGEC